MEIKEPKVATERGVTNESEETTMKTRKCTANDQFLVSEGVQCGNCLGLNGKHIAATERTASGSEHTPTPWEFNKDSRWPYCLIYVDKTKALGIERVAELRYASPANAELIVRAVNSHDELLAFAKWVAENTVYTQMKSKALDLITKVEGC